MTDLDDIEYKIAQNELTAPQVFTKMAQIIASNQAKIAELTENLANRCLQIVNLNEAFDNAVSMVAEGERKISPLEKAVDDTATNYLEVIAKRDEKIADLEFRHNFKQALLDDAEAEIAELKAVIERLADDEWMTEFTPKTIGMSEATANSYEAEIEARINYARSKLT